MMPLALLEHELPPLLPPPLTESEKGRLQGFWEGCAASQPFIEQERSAADRFYRVAARGGFGVPIIKPQGKTFAALEESKNAGAK